jgi:H/ACA ribonucleoprotein complex subunit 3
MKHIFKCTGCLEYTISNKCPKCGEKAVTPKPAKYSPQDKYAKYRRIAKGMNK